MILRNILYGLTLGGVGYYVWQAVNKTSEESYITTIDEESGRGGFMQASLDVVGNIASNFTINENETMTPSIRILNLLKRVERFSAVPYLAQEGQMTVGYGHVILPTESFSGALTQQAADELFLSDINKHTQPILSQVKVPLNQNQYDALISFVFNTGHVGYDMADFINNGDFDSAANEFMKFVYYSERKNGKKTGKKLVSNGLYARRKNEMNIFRFGQYPSDLTAV